jgi:hypothetical protein
MFDSDIKLARQLLDTAVRLIAEMTDAYTIIAAIEGAAKLFVLEQRPELGTEFVGTARRLREQTGIVAPKCDADALQRAINSAAAVLGATTFESHLERGRRRSPRAAIELYLSSIAS